MPSSLSVDSTAWSPRDVSIKDPALTELQRSMSAELEGMLLRALEMGVQKAAELFEKSADLAMNCSHCVTEMEAAKLASISSRGLNVRVGYYGNTDIIAHLLHLIVQLALFPRPPSADAVLQVHSRSARTSDQGMQIGSLGAPLNKEVQVPSLQVTTPFSSGCPGQPMAGNSLDGSAKDLRLRHLKGSTEGGGVVVGEVEHQGNAVRIGGGWHVFRTEETRCNQSIGLSPRQASSSPRTCSASPGVSPGPEERHPFAHGAPSRHTARHRFAFGAYTMGTQQGYTVPSTDPARLAKEVSRGRLRPRYGLYRVLRPRSAVGSGSSCQRISRSRKSFAPRQPCSADIWPDPDPADGTDGHLSPEEGAAEGDTTSASGPSPPYERPSSQSNVSLAKDCQDADRTEPTRGLRTRPSSARSSRESSTSAIQVPAGQQPS